jgi:hypothetical protein
MFNERKEQLSRLLENLTDSLEIPEARYKEAEEHYKAVGRWLGKEGSLLERYDPDIYPQGSFRLGTVVKPITDQDEYDIDLVCQLELTKHDVTQKELKRMVGNRLAENSNYNRMIDKEEGRRCWTLQYADDVQFHMDILPAIPDEMDYVSLLLDSGVPEVWAKHAICITDKNQWNYEIYDNDWPRSNPRGYSEWFRERMKVQFEAQRIMFAEKMRVSIEDVPDYRIKTTLQRSIQLLKRHRDIMFEGDPDDKPISIIITTLAALAYSNQADIYDALVSIVLGMPSHIQKLNGVFWIPNPVNPKENFADKWNENLRKESKFRNWLLRLRADLETALEKEDIRSIAEYLKGSFGEKVINESLKQILDSDSPKAALAVGTGSQVASRFNVKHRQKPIWPVINNYSVSITGQYSHNGHWHNFSSNRNPLSKQLSLRFIANTNVLPPFTVYWQVVNTGDEAASFGKKGLRGEIFLAKTAGMGGLQQRESTLYTGMHWIECFIVKNDVCLARSGEYVVNIQ